MPKSAGDDLVGFLIMVILILFGLFIGYQLVVAVLGGSWAPEDIIIALLVFTLCLCVALLRKSDRNSCQLRGLERSFCRLADDFKSHMDEYHHPKDGKR